MFQNLALYPDKTVYDNLAFPLRQRKLPKDEIERRVEAAARDAPHRAPARSASPAKLSGGERQRVALGRAIVRDPKAYLLDEPISALDALLRLEMRTELKRLQRDLGRTLVYVTHDQVEAMSMADRIAGPARGRRPADRRRRRTSTTGPPTGSSPPSSASPPMNFIPATAAWSDGALTRRATTLFSLSAPGTAAP